MGKQPVTGVTKNQVVEMEVTGMTAEGSGVGRVEGFAVFVPRSAVGDVLRVKILKRAKSYAVGKIESILTPSSQRIPQDCPHFGSCGGCAFRHIAYEAELALKEQRVRDALERIGGLDASRIDMEPIHGAQRLDGYRNKAQFPIGRGRDGRLVLGFYAPRSHRIVPCDICLLQPPVFAAAVSVLRDWDAQFPQEVYDEAAGTGLLRHLYLRWGQATGEVLACLVINGESVPGEQELARMLRERVPGLRGFLINSNREQTNVVLGKSFRTVWGSEEITDVLCGLTFRISPRSFYQVNREQAEVLYGIAARYAQLAGKETVLDLYCGTGTIGLSMARQAGRVIGVEVVAEAVEDAKRNAACNGLADAEFFCGDAAAAADRLAKDGVRPDVLILDPPRKGCAVSLWDAVEAMQPKRIVYVSCDPATLARDVKELGRRGYGVRRVAPVDLFPRTAHVETVVQLYRIRDDAD